jgi:hypothetical protein
MSSELTTRINWTNEDKAYFLIRLESNKGLMKKSTRDFDAYARRKYPEQMQNRGPLEPALTRPWRDQQDDPANPRYSSEIAEMVDELRSTEALPQLERISGTIYNIMESGLKGFQTRADEGKLSATDLYKLNGILGTVRSELIALQAASQVHDQAPQMLDVETAKSLMASAVSAMADSLSVAQERGRLAAQIESGLVRENDDYGDYIDADSEEIDELEIKPSNLRNDNVKF